MANNIFGGGNDEKKQNEFSERVDIHSKAILTVVERQKDIESQIDLIHEKIELIDNNTVKDIKKIFTEIKEVKSEMRDLKNDMKDLKDFNSKMQKQLKLMTTKDEVEKLEKYIDLWNPMGFVSRDEIKELRSNIKKDIKDIISKFLEED